MIKKSLLLILLIATSFQFAVSQTRRPKPAVKDSSSSDVFMDLVDQTLFDYYKNISKLPNSETILNTLEADSDIEEVSDAKICKRIAAMNELSTYKFDCNAITLQAIRGFMNRRSFVSICLGRSKMYFGLYEKYLEKYDLPHNLKYLSVIESALNPTVRSRAGALGLWQFMYGTGKMYGLQSNSYFDERMDPEKSTEAAVRYLKKLYDIYADWNLALAAYNAGPGNVNRAIRRSGGKVSYWAIRNYLPRETQQYVPRFIAATYTFVYAKQNGIKAAPSDYNYYQLDTMCLQKGVKMSSIESLIGWKVDSIKYFNPIYKSTYIPKTTPPQCISGPLTYIGRLVSMEDSLYREPTEDVVVPPATSNPNDLYPISTTTVYEDYVVKKGQSIEDIAAIYNISPTLIKQANNLSDEEDLLEAQRIKIPKKVVSSIQTSGIHNVIIYDTIYYDTIVDFVHIVSRNENLTLIANKYKVKVDSIIYWNHLKDKWINIGQKLKIHGTEKKFVLKPSTNQSKSETNKSLEVKSVTKSTHTKPHYHTVRNGELFNRIASRYGLSVAQLRRLNPRVNPNRISVGQRLRIK